MIVDGFWVSVGSTNFDPRSFSLNDEANLNISDAGFAGRQIEIFLQDIALAKAVSLAQWRGRPLGEKFIEKFASLFGRQL